MSWSRRPTSWGKPGHSDRGDEGEAVLDQIDFLSTKPIAQMRQTSSQSTTSDNFTAIQFQAEDVDNYNGHDNSTNNTRYTCKVAGWYRLSGKVGWAANATGRRAAQWFKNGSALNASQTAIIATSASDVEHPAVSMLVSLAVDDYVELHGFQESGGALSTTVTTAQVQSIMTVEWVSTV